MSATTAPVDLLLRPRDPLIFRDARPFAADPGARAVTLDWPLPSTIAGALRTHIGTATGVDWDNGPGRARALGLELNAALRVERGIGEDGWTVYLPSPADAVVYVPAGAKTPRVMRLRPDEALREGEGCNLPLVNGVALLPLKIAADEKPERDYSYWSLADTIAWLRGDDRLPERHRANVPQETRVHVAVSPTTLTSEEGRLFVTTGLAFGPAIRKRAEREADQSETAILCRLSMPGELGWRPRPAFLPLGGERRQVRLEPARSLTPDPWTIPDTLFDRLVGQTRLRLQLVTPAIFRDGWCPGWLTQPHRNRIPDAVRGLGLTLRAAAVGRRIPISGWDYTHRCEKPIRYAAPAGSVYFFEITQPLTEERVRRLWLAPLSDGAFNRQDGFGLVVPGLW